MNAKLCEGCVKSCKQAPTVVVITCPMYKKAAPKPKEPKRVAQLSLFG